MGVQRRIPAGDADAKGGAKVGQDGLREVSWKEVAKHNTKESCWLTVDDIAYDLTDYVDKHPGGAELMLTFAGREASWAFESYHAMSGEKAREKLQYYAVARVVDSEFQRYPKDKTLYDDLKKNVRAYFDEKKIDHKEWTTGVAHFLFMMAIAAVSLTLAYGVVEGPWVLQLVGAIMFGWIQGMHVAFVCSFFVVCFLHLPLTLQRSPFSTSCTTARTVPARTARSCGTPSASSRWTCTPARR